jgi:hypothetical protein
VRENWRKEWGLGELIDDKGLGDAFDEIEKDLEVAETASTLFGGQSHYMDLACKKLGLPGKPMTRNAARCRATAQCLQGCPGEARQSMDVSYVPTAMADGARLHTLVRVTRVLIEGGRAVGVEGEVLDADTRKPKGRARIMGRRAVIVAASVIYTPVILRKSGLRGMVGERFQAHPGCAVIGRFPFPIQMGRGATQGYEVPMRDRGWKLETLSLPPEMLVSRLPGAGARWQERMLELDHYAQWCTLIRMEAKGSVRPPFLGGSGAPATVHFEPAEKDLWKLKNALALLCRMMFSVGATEVFPGIGRLPEVFTDVSQVELLDHHDLRHADVHMMASHLFGTAVAGANPATSAVGPDLQSHDVKSLYVMDASVFPTNLGVNPQHSIMALVFRAAARLANATLTEARASRSGKVAA